MNKKRFSNFFISRRLAPGLLACGVALLARLPMAAGPPCSDEGYYAFHTMLAHKSLALGEGLPPFGPLHLYPALLSFVFSWDVNHLIALRLCDLVVALILAWQWFRLLEEESGETRAGLALALLFIFAFNQPLFIQRGFKNAIPIAFIFLILALRQWLKAGPGSSHWIFFRCGALAALAALFREALLPFALVGFMGVAVARGRRAALWFMSGGLGCALVVLAGLAAARGGFDNIVSSYAAFFVMARELGQLTADSRLYLGLSLKAAAFLAPVAAAAALGLALYRRSGRKGGAVARLLFWAALALAPLPEMLAKGAYGYHYATCLLGLSGLAAGLLRHWSGARAGLRGWGGLVAALALAGAGLWAAPQALALAREWPSSWRLLAERLPRREWPPEAVAASNYLLMAQAVTKEAATGGETLKSGFYYVLYPLTGLFPPRDSGHRLYNLQTPDGFTPETLRDELKKERPDIIVVDSRPGYGVEIVAASLAELPEYEKTAEIPVNPANDYGGFGAAVYARRGSPLAPGRD